MTRAESSSIPDRGDAAAVVALLFRVGASFNGYTSQMRRALSINAHESLAISTLWLLGPQTMTELGAKIPLSRAAVTTLVDRLEGTGLVKRASDPHDRRRTLVNVTEATLDRMRPVIASWGQTLHALVATRDPDAWHTIGSFLEEFEAMNRDEARLLAALDDEAIMKLAQP